MAELLASFFSSFISSKVEKLSVQELKDFFRGKINEEVIQNLKMSWCSISAVLSDAEEKQFIDPYVKEWVDNLKSTVYDVDDLFDEIVIKAKNKGSDYASFLNVFSEGLQSRVEGIVERLKTIVDLKDTLGLKEGGIGKSLSYVSATTSLVDKSRVHGRNVDIEKIVDFLLCEHSNQAGVAVVAMVGMRGIGKTTLAQVVYNDERVMNHFEERSWASVSESMNMSEITKEVLESFMLCQTDVVSFDTLQLSLKKRLKGKKFLVVLDAYENECYLDWDVFLKPFQSAECGGTIILTTRSARVALGTRADLIHPLPFLSDEDSWELFSYHALMAKNQNQESGDLKEIGLKIVNRCRGLPLALITLGSILYSKESNEEWENVYDSTLVELSRGKRNMFSELISSYVNLPLHLQRCFAFCAIYPRRSKIDKLKLIYFWMAHGLLPRTPGKRMEDIGEECFEELVSKSFLYRESQYYLMHNLMHELSECVAGDFFYKWNDSTPKTIDNNNVRHLSYLMGVYDDKKFLHICRDCKLLRTFLPFDCMRPQDWKAIRDIIKDMLSKAKRMRVLSLAGYEIDVLPHSVVGLLHLRYLDLSYTTIKSLPNSICFLYNLETLLLVGCSDLYLLPEKTSNLINLRQLDISNSGVKKMPEDFGKLKSIQLLPCFVVGDDGRSNISELGELSGLHGSLSLVNLQNVLTEEEASNARLIHKEYLHELMFKWTASTHNQESENTVFDKLNPHSKLRRLKIHGFGGDRFPIWQQESSSYSSGDRSGSLNFLEELCIENCPNLTGKLPGKLPSLTKLEISSCPSLQDSMPWVPRLRELHITSCETFVSLPEEMMKENQNIQSIFIKSCTSLVSFPMSVVSRTVSCLEISDCPKLELYPQGLMENSQYYPVLKRLHLLRCDSLAIFQFSFFPKLEELIIEGCPALHSILSAENCLLCLQKLELRDCSKLVLFPGMDFPVMPSLTSLSISGLANLTSLEHVRKECLTSLKILKIEDCINLESLPPVTSLLYLSIKSCDILRTECESDTGKYKSMMSLIQNVEFED